MLAVEEGLKMRRTVGEKRGGRRSERRTAGWSRAASLSLWLLLLWEISLERETLGWLGYHAEEGSTNDGPSREGKEEKEAVESSNGGGGAESCGEGESNKRK